MSDTCQVEAGVEPVPVSFPYHITALESGKTHMFKPNALDQESAVRSQTMGALMAGKYDKVAASPRVRVLWEAICFSFSEGSILLCLHGKKNNFQNLFATSCASGKFELISVEFPTPVIQVGLACHWT